MQCPSCNHFDTKVLESRATEGGKSIRRRRECLKCLFRFTTYERREIVPVTVVKKDGKRESFDGSKLLKGITMACEKTNISNEILESIVDDIEVQLQQQPRQEVSSREIGQLVLNHLRQVSPVGYIRFASVYDQFTAIEDFLATIKKLQKEPKIEENQEN